MSEIGGAEICSHSAGGERGLLGIDLLGRLLLDLDLTTEEVYEGTPRRELHVHWTSAKDRPTAKRLFFVIQRRVSCICWIRSRVLRTVGSDRVSCTCW